MKTPKELGYYFPAEWKHHRATWLTWPHNLETWPGKIETIYPYYCEFIRVVTEGERVCINVNDMTMQKQAEHHLTKAGVDLNKIDFFHHPSNDAWCRDHGPSVLLNHTHPTQRAILDWGYNAWGGKYPPFDSDDKIPSLIAEKLNLPCFYPGIIMEGGSVEFNGKGTVITTKACLLNPNRNPHLNQKQVEKYLIDFYGVDQVLWLLDGIEGDDTDGHIDDLTRFVNENTVVTMIETDASSPNYPILKENADLLSSMHLADGSPLNVIEIPMPAPLDEKEQILPASYANFYISNAAVVVPIFKDRNDEKALEIIAKCFPDRKTVGIDSRDIVYGLGSFHCLSQQEPS